MVRNDPLREIEELQERLMRAFGVPAQGRSVYAPPVDVTEDNQGLHFAIYLPGVEPDQVEVSTEQSTLTVRAERPLAKTEGVTHHRLEGLYGTFVRSFSVPPTFDLARTQARFRHGVLHLDVPRSESAQPRRVQVHVE
jgi:HSP20 family protein